MRPVKDFETPEATWTIEEAAEKLGRSVRTMHRFLRAGMPSRIDGKRLALAPGQVRAWLAQQGLLKV